MSKKFIAGLVSGFVLVLLTPAVAMAHVVVTPAQAGLGEEVTFSVSVPNEEQAAVTNLKLEVPDGVTDVMPTSKDSWTITTTNNGDTKEPAITAIVWSNGTIPAGQRQDFSFSAQVPGKATELDWKAYQTYADGTVVHWDQKPAGSDDNEGDAGPYSVTKVVNDLATTPAAKNTSSNTVPLVLSIVAIALSASNFVMRRKK